MYYGLTGYTEVTLEIYHHIHTVSMGTCVGITNKQLEMENNLTVRRPPAPQ